MSESKRERYIRLLKSKSDLDVVEFIFDAVKEIIELLEETPTVDCTICKYCKYHVQEDEYWYCNKWQRETKEYWFCSRGKKWEEL